MDGWIKPKSKCQSATVSTYHSVKVSVSITVDSDGLAVEPGVLDPREVKGEDDAVGEDVDGLETRMGRMGVDGGG